MFAGVCALVVREALSSLASTDVGRFPPGTPPPLLKKRVFPIGIVIALPFAVETSNLFDCNRVDAVNDPGVDGCAS